MIMKDWRSIDTSPKRYNWGAIVEGVLVVTGVLVVIVCVFVYAFYKNI